jgi:hypothetical protein
LVVGNNDYAKFNYLRNLSHDDIETSNNVRVIDGIYNKDFIFTMVGGQRQEKDIIDLKIGFETEVNGTRKPINNSFVDLISTNNFTYKWTFQDGAIQFGINPTRSASIGENVRLTLVKDGVDFVNTEATVRGGPPYPCDHEIRTIAKGGCDVEIIIGIAWRDNVIGRVEWTLPNGTKKSGQKIDIGNKLKFDASNNGQPVCLKVALYDKAGNLVCEQTHCVWCKCGDTWTVKDNSSEVTIQGKVWRADVEIWVQNGIFVESCGSKTRSMRKDGNSFSKKPVDLLYASFKGIIQCGEIALCPDEVIPFSEETEANGGHLQRDVDPSCDDPSVIRNMNRCESTHWFKKSGVTVAYTKNGGKLFLN